MAFIYGASTYATLNSSSAKKYEVRVGYEAQPYNILENTTPVKLILEVRTIDAEYYTYGFTQTSTLGGVKFGGKKFSVRNKNEWVTFASTEITVTHNNDGTYSGTVSGSFTTNATDQYSLKSGSASVQMTLPTIPRATTPTISSTSLTMGTSATITLAPASSTFKHKLKYSFGGVASLTDGLSIGSDFSPSGNITITFTPPASLGNYIPTSTGGHAIITCTTYDANGTQIGEPKPITVTVNVPSYTPTISIAIKGNDLLGGVYVQGKSTATYTITANGKYGSAIQTYTSTLDGVTYSGSSFTTNELSNGTKVLTVTVVDSRGKSATANAQSITVEPYSIPSITSFTASRGSDETTVVAKMTGSVASVGGKNTSTLTITLNGETKTVTSGSSVTFTGLSTELTYTAVAKITDAYTTVSKSISISTVDVTLDFNASGKGIALGKVSEKDAFEVNMPVEIHKTLDMKGNRIINANLVDLISQGIQQTPLFAESEAWLKENGDTSKVYVLPDGYIYAYLGKQGEGGTTPNFVNQLPISQEIDSTNKFNGVGYMTGKYLTTSSPFYANGQTNEWLTGFIPYTIDKSIYIKGVSFTTASHDRMYFFSDKATRVAPAINSVATNLGTYFTIEQLGTDYCKLTPISGAGFVNTTQYVRMGFTSGNPAEVIITVNEPITYTTSEGGEVYEWVNTYHAFVPADYEDRIIALESSSNQLKTDILDVKSTNNQLKTDILDVESTNDQLKADIHNVEQRIDDLENGNANNSNVPNYIVEEAERVAKAVQSVRTSKTLVFSAMSDIHLYDENTLEQHTNSLISAQSGGMGLKEIQKRMDLDFVSLLGDYSYMSSNSYNANQVMNDITLAKKTLDISGDKQIWCVGNHDWCYGTGVDRMLTEDELYSFVGSNSEGVKPYESIERCFGYLDFDNQKIRVIYLNTNDCKDGIDNNATTKDNYQYMEMISPTQMRWFGDVALNFNDKSDSSEWGIVILSHQPIDYGYAWYTRILELLEAYRESKKVTLNCLRYYLNGQWVQQSETFDFTSVENPAEIICNVHGHIHNCASKKVSSSSSVNAWLWRFCVPNMCVGRYNEKYDTKWGEVDGNGNKVEWTKELGTAKETSFNIISIDRKNKKIYAHIFGAGKDRVFSYDGEYIPQEYTITTTLSNCSSASGNPTTIIEGLSASLVFNANNGYELPTEITVSGATYTWDSTSGTLSLSNPTNNVSITITANVIEVPVVNLIDMSTRTHAPMTTPQFVEPEQAHEMDYTKIYDAVDTGRRGSYPSGKLTKFEVLSDANGFTYQVSSSSGYGLEFPVQLKGGKTYELNYTTETNDSHVQLIKYNADTTVNASTRIQTGTTTVGNRTVSITAEDGYLYSIHFGIRTANIELTVKNISLLEK